ncbi:MAG: hypothetical protein ACRDQG_00020 [Pseudonocardiaceae bacterium]
MASSPGLPRLSPRGFRGPGLGRASYVEAPTEYRGTTVQVCGLWPYAAGSGTPMVGTPIGHHLRTGATVCFDPISWFTRANLISQPSMFVLGRPGLGKSTFTRRTVIGLAAQRVTPLVLGDLKPDYAHLVAALGGQVVKLGRGLGALNPLDVGALGRVLPRLSGAAAARVRAEVRGRQLTMTAALITLARRRPVTDHEETILATALRLLDERHADTDPPLLSDLVTLLADGHPDLHSVTLARGADERYRTAVDPLHRSLLGLLDGPLGSTFARHTTVPLDLDAPAVCIDISGIHAADERLQAAVLLACWSDGFGAIEAAHTLADAGRAPQRLFYAVMDELWRVLRSGAGMVDRVDELTRLNRGQALGTAYITHSLADLEALQTEQDRAKARGFVERAAVVVCGGLPQRELHELTQVVSFSQAEQRMITEWSTPPSWDAELGREAAPPGQGNFLIKIGQKPGIPVHVDLTPAELATAVHNTNQRWQTHHGQPGPQ